MLIPEHQIEEILERIDIVAFVSRYVELKKAGRSYKARCPFHEEKTPSFHVTPELRRFKCFGCQASGDVIAFAQKYLGKSFVDVVRELAREAGVQLEASEDASSQERRHLKEATDLAAAHFAANLAHPEIGRVAREYLKGRGIDEQTTQIFGLGWANDRWNELCDQLMQAGILEWGIGAGLVQKRAQGDGYYDLFRGRLMIAIRSPEGRTIAFGGRLLQGESGPKYLNSRESLLFKKSETLYGMDRARTEIRKQKKVVLVEGYFDCISLHQVGITNAVALCSTTLTPGQLSLLARSEAKELYLLLDGDEAGRQAVERLTGPLLAAGAIAKVALLPPGEDPDTFARKHGESGVRTLMDAARPLTEHLFNEVLPAGRQATFEQKMKALERLKPVVAQLPPGLTRSAFFSSMGAHLALPPSELERNLRGRPGVARPVPKTPGGEAVMRQARGESAGALEAAYAACLLRDPALAGRDPYSSCDNISHPAVRALVGALFSGDAPEDALFEASAPLKAALEHASQQLPAEAAALEVAFATVCRKLKLRWIDEQLRHIAEVAGRTEGVNELTEETRRLQGERISLLALRREVLQAGNSAVAAGMPSTLGS